MTRDCRKSKGCFKNDLNLGFASGYIYCFSFFFNVNDGFLVCITAFIHSALSYLFDRPVQSVSK